MLLADKNKNSYFCSLNEKQLFCMCYVVKYFVGYFLNVISQEIL